MKLYNLDKNDRAKLEAIILKWQNPDELFGEDGQVSSWKFNIKFLL